MMAGFANGAAAERKRIRMLVPLWGEAYFRKWLELPAASLLAPGNVPHAQRGAAFELVFLCKAADVDFLERHPRLRALSAEVPVKTVTIDEFFPRQGSVSYGVPLTLAYAKGIADLGEDGLGTYVVLMNSDFVLSDGSLAHLLALIDQDFHIVTAPSIRVVEHTARAAFVDLLSRQGAGRAFTARTMMAQILQHLHLTVTARTLNRPHPVDAWHYHEMFWQVSPSCLAARYFLMMPFCFQVRRRIQRVLCPVDYGFIQECCPGGRYTVAGDSDDLLIMELQHRDSESDLLDLAPPLRTPDEALAYRVERIVESAARWTTAEHRRAFAYDVLFHAEALQPDVDRHLAEFRAQMARVVAALPPAASAIRHFHWLGALHFYRRAMHDSGLPSYPALIDDEANRRFVALTTAAAPAPTDGQPEGDLSPPAPPEATRGATVVVTLDVTARAAMRQWPEARILTAALDEAHSLDMATTFLLPDDLVPGGATTLAFDLLIDSLAHWPKFRPACDAVLRAGGQAVVVFRDAGGRAESLADRPWVLSMLSYLFPAQDYVVQLEFLPGGDLEQDAVNRPCPGLVVRPRPRAAADAVEPQAVADIAAFARRVASE